MRTVGCRKVRPVSITASGLLLAEGARFNDEIHQLPTGETSFIPKNVKERKTEKGTLPFKERKRGRYP